MHLKNIKNLRRLSFRPRSTHECQLSSNPSREPVSLNGVVAQGLPGRAHRRPDVRRAGLQLPREGGTAARGDQPYRDTSKPVFYF